MLKDGNPDQSCNLAPYAELWSRAGLSGAGARASGRARLPAPRSGIVVLSRPCGQCKGGPSGQVGLRTSTLGCEGRWWFCVSVLSEASIWPGVECWGPAGCHLPAEGSSAAPCPRPRAPCRGCSISMVSGLGVRKLPSAALSFTWPAIAIVSFQRWNCRMWRWRGGNWTSWETWLTCCWTGSIFIFSPNGLVGQGGAKTLISQHPASHAGQIPSQLYLIVDCGVFYLYRAESLNKSICQVSSWENIDMPILKSRYVFDIVFLVPLAGSVYKVDWYIMLVLFSAFMKHTNCNWLKTFFFCHLGIH